MSFLNVLPYLLYHFLEMTRFLHFPLEMDEKRLSLELRTKIAILYLSNNQ
jgi:hypothetical protein